MSVWIQLHAVYACTHVHMYIRTYTDGVNAYSNKPTGLEHVHIRTYMYIHVRTYMYVCTCTYI